VLSCKLGNRAVDLSLTDTVHPISAIYIIILIYLFYKTNSAYLMTTKSALLLTGLIFFSTILSGQVKKTISPVFNSGDQYVLKNTTISDIHDDGVRTINQNFANSWFLRIIGKTADGDLMIRATYLKINQRTENLFSHDLTGFNSDDFKEFVAKSTTDELHHQNDQLRKLGEAMIGKSFTVYLTDDWKVDVITGVDTLIDEALAGMGEEDAAFAKTTKASITNEEIGKIIGTAFTYIPDDAVGTGDKWSKDENHHVGALKVEYTVKAEEGSNMEITVSSPSVMNSEIQATYSRKGTYTVDTRTGLLVQSSVRDDMKPKGELTRVVIKTIKNEVLKK